MTTIAILIPIAIIAATLQLKKMVDKRIEN